MSQRSGFGFSDAETQAWTPAEGAETETTGPILLRNLFCRQCLCRPIDRSKKIFEQMPELVYLILVEAKEAEKDFAVRLGLA